MLLLAVLLLMDAQEASSGVVPPYGYGYGQYRRRRAVGLWANRRGDL